MVKPMPPYFLVTVPREDQKERKEKIGSIYLHPSHVFMTRNMQCGQIVDIGKDAAEIIPDAKKGDTLLFHHFVENDTKCQLVDSDQDYYYYVVNALYHNGQNNQTYGIWDGKNIIPSPEYIFLEKEPSALQNLSINEFLNKATRQNDKGIIEFTTWKVTRDDLMKNMEKLRQEIQSLSKSKMTDVVMKEIHKRESEMNAISKMMMKKSFQLYNVVAVNPEFNLMVAETFGCWLAAGSKVYMLNIACETIIEFDNREYIVAKTLHFGIPEGWVKKQYCL